MEALDLKKRFGRLYKPNPKGAPEIVDVPPLRFLMLDGVGGIGEAGEYDDGIQALYGLAYPVKFAAKKQLEVSYQVMPLEGLYWHVDGGFEISMDDRESWAWTLMLLLPDEVSAEFVDETRVKVAAKKDLRRLGDVRVQTFTEGACVQALHIGPWAEEPPTIAAMARFAADKDLAFSGKHHELYLNDPTKTTPEKLKTIVRYPVARAPK